MWPVFFPVNTTIPTGPVMNGCFESSSSIRLCSLPGSWYPETSIIIPVPRGNDSELIREQIRDEGVWTKPRAPRTNQMEPATKKRRDEGCVNKPCPVAVAETAVCKICGHEGRLQNCHVCSELGCKKCNYWCSERKGGCGLIICAECNDFDGAVTKGQKGLWHCSNCKPLEPRCD